MGEEQSKPAWASVPYPKLPHNIAERTQQCINTYLASKGGMGDGGIAGVGWWQAANGYTAMALHDHWAGGGKRNYDLLARNLKECEKQRRGFVNEFIDDSLWWAICCVHVFMLGGDRWFLEKAEGVWRHVVDGGSVVRKGQYRFRDQDMEGAVFWTTNKDEEQVNSISTGLFAELSVRLALLDDQHSSTSQKDSKGRALVQKVLGHRHTSQKQYVEAAKCSLNWILRCRFRQEDAVVLDGILLRQGAANDWTFTYTTGVTIGVLALLYEATREEEHIKQACRLARRSMQRESWVAENGVLTEPGAYGRGKHDAYKNNDAVGFKSVLIRHLATLYDVITRTNAPQDEAKEIAEQIKTFININFQSQQDRNTNGHGQYGPWWDGPFER